MTDVVTLRDALVLRIMDDRYALSRSGPHAKNASTMAEVNHALDALIAAVRADATRAAEGPHGVGFVDKVGIECLCERTFSFGSGGWIAFNAHLARAAEAEVAGLRDALSAIKASLQREYDGVSGGDRPPYYANGVMYALITIDNHTAALAAQPAVPSPRCPVCGHEPHDSALGCTFESSVEPDWFCACSHTRAPR